MLKTCVYCGRIHDRKFDCGRKPKRKKKYGGKKESFRWTSQWQKKREEIKQRDRYLCQACLHGAPGTEMQFNTERLSVHHIINLEKDFEKRLDNENLITLCQYHHEKAEEGSISEEQLRSWIPPGGAR